MKVSSSQEVGFRPIEIKITIEGPEELCELWHRLRFISKDITPEYRESNALIHPFRSNGIKTIALFEELDDLAAINNLKRH